MWGKRSVVALVDTTVGWLPFLVVFLVLPVSLYVSNRADFEYRLDVLVPFFAAAAVSFVALFAGCLLGVPGRAAIVNALFFLGVFIAISDSLIPLHLGLMDGSETLQESSTSIIIQAVLAIIIATSWWLVPKPAVRAFGLPVVLVMLAWQGMSLARNIGVGPAGAQIAPSLAQSADPGKQRPNIYHVVFDGYSSLVFPRLAEHAGLTGELRGFTFFPKNVSNYQVTDESVPSFMTGQLFRGGSFKDFQLRAMTAGLRGELKNAGYEISIYSPNQSRSWMHNGASYVYTSEKISRERDWLRLAQVALVRASPEILRSEVYSLTNTGFGGRMSSYAYYKRLSVPLMEKFLSDEASRPGQGQYVYVHMILPHPPFVWAGSDCRPASKSNYLEQATCATWLMKSFVAKLKQLNRYEHSLILLHSDHGSHDVKEPYLAFTAPLPEILETLRSRQTFFGADGFFRRLHSLLLIKPPASADAPLRVSDQPTQLVDVSPTVLDLLKLPQAPTDGRSVFADRSETPREISVFDGVYRRNAARDPLVLGRNTNHAILSHFKYDPERGWRVEPNIEATHEGW